MAQEQESSSTSTSIPRVGKHSRGYDPRQVDAFVAQAHRLYDEGDPSLTLAGIQNASFAMVKGGYVPANVDAMLDRLKSALCDKQTLAEISELGRVAWKAQMEESLRELQRHADRDHGARFASGQHKMLSYKRKQVDQLIDDIMDKAAYELSEVTTDGTHPAVGNDPYPNLNAKAIENAAFTVVKGPRGYDQRQVDYYLATCADLLGRLESYQRLNENGSIPASGTVERPASAAPVNGVKPLFANVPQTQGDDLPGAGIDAADQGAVADAAQDGGPGRGLDDAVTHDEDVFTGGFGNETVGVQHHGFVVAVFLGFDLGQDGVHVVAGGLGLAHQGVDVHAGEGAGLGADAHFQGFGAEVGAPGPHGDDGVDLVVAGVDAHFAITHEGQGTDVAFLHLVGFQGVQDALADLVDGVGNVQTQDLRGIE